MLLLLLLGLQNLVVVSPAGVLPAPAANNTQPYPPQQFTTDFAFDEFKVEEWRNCGDCWREECGYCSNPECGVQHGIVHGGVRITVRSVLRWKRYNKIVLFDTQGRQLGTMIWNLRGFFLKGCTACRPKSRIPHNRGALTEWTFSLNNGVVAVAVNEVPVFQEQLSESCAEHYGNVGSFSFLQMRCDQFLQNLVTMKLGAVFEQSDDTCSVREEV